jgi:hypothetical protein
LVLNLHLPIVTIDEDIDLNKPMRKITLTLNIHLPIIIIDEDIDLNNSKEKNYFSFKYSLTNDNH